MSRFINLRSSIKYFYGGLISILLVGFFSALLFGCNNSQVANNPTGRITIGTTSTIRTLDPADAYDLLSGNILFNVCDRLYTYKPGTTDLIPELAADFPAISDDGLTYRIPLKSGIKFHDGTDFNASAMAFSLNRFIKLGGAPAFLLADIVKSVTAINPTELEIALKERSQFFPKLLAFTGAAAISPKAYGNSSGFLPNQAICTGVYQVAEYIEGNILRLNPFSDYWGEKPKNAGIDLQFISSNANLLNSFKTGGVDVAWQTLSPAQIHNLEVNANKYGWNIASNQGSVILYMVLNVKQSPLDHIKVRQAIAAAINRPLLAERVFQNQRIPLYSLVPKTLSDYKPTFQNLYGDGNGKLARKLLTEAGYSDTNPAQVSFWYAPKYAGNGDLVLSTLKAAITRDVGKILEIKLEKVDTTTAYGYLDQGVYPTFFLDWVPDIFDPDNFLQPFLTCDQGNLQNGCIKGRSQYQGAFYYNPEINDLISTQRIELNPQKRSALLIEIQEILARDVPFIPLWQNKEYAFGRSQIKGLKVEPTQQLNYANIYKSTK
ncbi:ABC-type dipeptide transport system, periplasmic component [Synechococcus sp. PCC 7502]|uniref:ABC transporter substrate-binding protein n=1 Tax=Synechococcus sp. PCC 7502 TaxID=1173263 RepID=UPI00029FEE3E|nr:ABC transporter substrate-binding protein [Synechococcus sp. PCC 7502]AFY74720.1 ABC-type dipeptide transport system, periplasmic component [Synechococcus sp. PCC 7502]